MKSIYNPNYNAGIVKRQIYYYYSRNCLYTQYIECIISSSYYIVLHLSTDELIFKLIYTVKQTRI